MGSEVDVQRRDGDVACINGGEISIRASIAFIARWANPVERIAPWILLRDHFIRRMAAAAARDANTFDLIERQIRNVNVQNAPGTQRLAR